MKTRPIDIPYVVAKRMLKLTHREISIHGGILADSGQPLTPTRKLVVQSTLDYGRAYKSLQKRIVEEVLDAVKGDWGFSHFRKL